MAKKVTNKRSRSSPPASPKRRAIERKAAPAAATTISELSVDIISDILLRLSDIKSIIRCTRVRKTWRDLILQLYFTQSQLSRGSLPLSFIFHSRSKGPLNPSFFGILDLDDPACLHRRNATMKFRFEIFLPYEDSSIRLIGACNGLICLGVGADIVVCNPILQGLGHFLLPKRAQSTGSHWIAGIGFGYSSVSDKYKVLRCVKSTSSGLSIGFEICTLGSDDTWRSVGGHHQSLHTYIYDEDFVFVKGAFHWVCRDMRSKFICCFDVENEEFKNLPLPCHIRSEGRFNLGVVDNCLCLSIWRSTHDVNVWVMNDSQDIGSWTMKWNFELHIRGSNWSVQPIKFFEDRIVSMIIQNKTLGFYNLQTGVLEKLKYRGIRLWSGAIAYTPSFISLPWML